MFDYYLSEDKKTLTLNEPCDMYIVAEMTKDQAINLANDLLRIAQTML